MRRRRLLLLIPLVIVVILVGGVVWLSMPSGTVMAEALAALESDAEVTVTTENWLTFRPTDGEPDTGFIFYPGGRVLPEAYAPTARRLAADGYLVVLVPMPLNLAVLAPNRAAEVIAAYPAIEQWAVGGHSLGGAMAATFVRGNPDAAAGLVLWAAYPQASDSLADRDDLTVTVISASEDGLATPAEVDAARQYLPDDTTYTVIEGGNHANFGWYGDQAGDNPATISRESQQDQLYEATRAVLDTIAA